MCLEQGTTVSSDVRLRRCRAVHSASNDSSSRRTRSALTNAFVFPSAVVVARPVVMVIHC